MTPLDAGNAARVRASFGHQHAMASLGAQMTEGGAGTTEMVLPCNRHARKPVQSCFLSQVPGNARSPHLLPPFSLWEAHRSRRREDALFRTEGGPSDQTGMAWFLKKGHPTRPAPWFRHE
ncbi:MAG TPA: hypothetical protein VFV38_52625 [Ktedonobacteraceae bacterium]|nr:hypothetical protein [Ktedonobacteraceae bacterium]